MLVYVYFKLRSQMVGDEDSLYSERCAPDTDSVMLLNKLTERTLICTCM